MAERDHSKCGADCIWCAVQRALSSRGTLPDEQQIDGSNGHLTDNRELLHDIDQLCNLLGDMIASIPPDAIMEALTDQAQRWIVDRVKESRARNMTHPTWRAMYDAGKSGAPLQ